MKRTEIARMSPGRRAKLKAEGIAFPSSTLVSRKPKMAMAGKRSAITGFDGPTTEAILARDGYSCARCGGGLFGVRGFDYSIQHRRARGAGGSLRPDTNAPQNGIALCGSAVSQCHGWVESHREEARGHGWAIRQDEDPLRVPVDHHLHGVVFLHGNGSWGSRPERAVS